MDMPQNHLSLEESQSLAKTRRARNIVVVCLLGLFVAASFAASLWHVAKEVN
jgi:flagellar basal body-associated protein FliL